MEKESAKIILSADSTCDLDTELKERYHVHYFPLHIILDGHDYKDGIDITPEEIFQKYYDEKILPKTAAVNVAEYIDHFEPWVRAVTKSFISISAVPSPVPIRIAVLRLKNSDMSMSLTVALFPAEQDSLSVMPEK